MEALTVRGLVLFLTVVVLHWHSTTTVDAQATDGSSVSLGSSLTSNQTWTSQNGTFSLGFYAIPTNADSLYLSVWFGGVSIAPIWMANRERPVKQGASLNLTTEGNLVLFDFDGTVVWASNTSGDGVIGATFLETGNIVLSNKSGGLVWNSFDYPTDTFVPGMTIGVGTKLVAWKTLNDPSAGLYSFRLEPNGELHFLWNETTVYYNSGPWSGNSYTNPPKLGLVSYPDKFTYSNSSGSPTISWTTFGRSITADTSFKRFRLDEDGSARQHIWVIENSAWLPFIQAPTQPCQVDRVCGQNALCINSNSTLLCSCLPGFTPVDNQEWTAGDFWPQGCQRTLALSCTNGLNEDKFYELNQTSFEGDSSVHSIVGQSDSGCRNSCLQDCACSGYTFQADVMGSNCSVQSTSVLYNGETSTSLSGSFFLRVSANFKAPTGSPPSGANKKSSGTSIVAVVTGVVFGSLALILLLLALLWWAARKRRAADNQASLDQITAGLVRFSYKELVAATNNFNQQLGKGGFGTVHKGLLPDNSVVAVKKLGKLRQGEREFRTEVAVIGTVQHINLVRLRGFCVEGDNRALVYEYLPNGSLERYLFKSSDREENDQRALDWGTRFSIALGTARGIAYLHEECRDRIIHCDIKPENILLEKDFTPKVSDFGLARLLGKDMSRVITNIRGTRGYLAPEWLNNSTLTSKADVYSYGMTLLELISGRRTVDLSAPSGQWFFAVYAFEKMAHGDFLSLVDNQWSEDVDEEQVKRAVRVALWCIQDDPQQRPTMGTVVRMLEGTLEATDPPLPKSLQVVAQDGKTPAEQAEAPPEGSQSSGFFISQIVSAR